MEPKKISSKLSIKATAALKDSVLDDLTAIDGSIKDLLGEDDAHEELRDVTGDTEEQPDGDSPKQ